MEWGKHEISIQRWKKKDKELKKYRPISVANTISNVYCGIIKEKIRNIRRANNNKWRTKWFKNKQRHGKYIHNEWNNRRWKEK